MKSALLGFSVIGTIALSPLPASAVPATSHTAFSHTVNTQDFSTTSPSSIGSILCKGDLCIQRTTPIINNKATVKAWANTFTFVGHFQLRGPDGHIANSPTQTWVAGGAGWNFQGVARGGGYTIIAWDGSTKLGSVTFSV